MTDQGAWGLDECEHEIRLVRARNDRLELEALEWMQFARRVRRYLDEQGAVHQHVKRMELDAWLRDKGIE